MIKSFRSKGVKVLCGLFGKTRQAFYEAEWQANKVILEEAIILKLVEEIRIKMPRIGVKKLWKVVLPGPLKEHGIVIGRDALFDLMECHGMLLKRKKRRVVTTNSYHRFRKYGNLIQGLVLTGPEQVWVSDITYLKTKTGFTYLSLITDAYSRKIVGFYLSTNLEVTGCLEALKMALSNWKRSSPRLIHHSDRGIQYCSTEYVKMLNSNDVLISMTQNGDPYENAIAERVNGILKSEFGLSKVHKTFEEASQSVFDSVQIYNELRPHMSCDYLTPEKAHEHNGILEKRWKSYTTTAMQESDV